MKNARRLLLASLLVLGSCGVSVGDIKEVQEFGSAVQAMYPGVSLSTGITNGSKLEVTFTNTSYNDSSEEVKQRVATDIGKIAPKYFKVGKITSGEAIFENSKSTVLVSVTSTHSYDMGIK